MASLKTQHLNWKLSDKVANRLPPPVTLGAPFILFCAICAPWSCTMLWWLNYVKTVGSENCCSRGPVVVRTLTCSRNKKKASTWGLGKKSTVEPDEVGVWRQYKESDIQQIIYYLLMRGAKGWCNGAEVSGSFSSNVGSQHLCAVKRTELSDGFISLKRKHLHSDSKEMPLRYLSLTLVVTERKAHCFLILSYLVCR